MSSSPSRGWPTCAAFRRAGGPDASSTGAPTRTFQPALEDYFERSLAGSPGKHTPHLLDESLSWHQHYLRAGRMLKR